MIYHRSYTFGFPHGEAPFEAQYREENEVFERFMKLTLGEQWITMKQMRIAVCQTVDSIIK